MGKKLFVGNLAWATDDHTLRQTFEKFGQVAEAKVIFDRDTGRSRGFGFVTYNTDDEAKKAVDGMNGQALDGKNLRIDFAQETQGRAGGGAPGAGAGRRPGGGDRGDRGHRE